MGKPRVRGSHAKIFVTNGKDGSEVSVGEVSKFSVKELGEIKKSRSMGEQEVTANKTFEGYDLSFEGGKVDWRAAVILHGQDKKIKDGERSALFKIKQQITYYGGLVEEYTYNDVVLYGYNLDMDANDEMTEKFEGFCGKIRVLNKDVTNSKIVAEDGAVDAAIKALIDAQNATDVATS
jgi:hypothetical protein